MSQHFGFLSFQAMIDRGLGAVSCPGVAPQLQRKSKMSNHFTGLNLGPPLGDQRLDLCDLYAFQSPTDGKRTVIILNANPSADALHPEAIYRLNIDTDGDCLTDIA